MKSTHNEKKEREDKGMIFFKVLIFSKSQCFTLSTALTTAVPDGLTLHGRTSAEPLSLNPRCKDTKKFLKYVFLFFG